MNNHFQSSETAWMVTGLTSESSGRYGSSLWVLSQVIQPRIAMITQGTSQTTASMRLEWCQSGLYSAWVFEARYFQANARVITITGMTTISISRSRRAAARAPGKAISMRQTGLLWSSSGLNRWKERVVAHGCLLARLVAETAGFSQFQTCSRRRGTERPLPGHGRRQADTFPDSGGGLVPRAESFLDEQRFRSCAGRGQGRPRHVHAWARRIALPAG